MRPKRFPDELAYSFESQARQHPATGKPGLSYARGDLSDIYGAGAYVDTLLWRNRKGALVGVLYHYPRDFPPYEVAGNVNIWVRPDRQRRGIGTRLVTEALRRWPGIDPAQQRYSTSGLALARHLGMTFDESDESPMQENHVNP